MMIKEEEKKTSSSAFYQERKVQSLTIFHDILHFAQEVHNDLKIRQFQKSDLIEIIYLHKELFPINYGSYFYSKILNNQVSCLIVEASVDLYFKDYVAVLKKHSKKKLPINVEGDQYTFYRNTSQKYRQKIRVKIIVGLAVFQVSGSRGYLQQKWWKGWISPLENSVYIMTLGVIEEYRKKGVGKLVIDAILNEAKQNEEVKLVFLHVIQYNEAAIRLYKKMGFEELEELQNFYAIKEENFGGKALGMYVNGGKRRETWWQWVGSWWK